MLQSSALHRMPSPSSRGLMSLTPSATPRATDGSYGRGEEKEKSLLLHVQFCYSACQHRLNARAEVLKGKTNFVRNTGSPLQMGSIEPALNSSFHLLRPGHLLGHNRKEVEIAVQHPSINRRRSPSAIRHIKRKTAQPKSQGLTAPFQFS